MLKLAKNVQNQTLAHGRVLYPPITAGRRQLGLKRGQNAAYDMNPKWTKILPDISQRLRGNGRALGLCRVDTMKKVALLADMAVMEVTNAHEPTTFLKGKFFRKLPNMLGTVRAKGLALKFPSACAPFSTGPTTDKDSLEHFRSHLERQFARNPKYDIKSIFKLLKKLPSRNVNAFETAFDLLARHRRPEDGATIMLHMQKEGLLATNPTRAKMMALSLSMALPQDVSVEDVVYNICEIVGHAEYTEKQFVDLLRIMQVYDVDRLVVAVIVNYFRECQGRNYVPRLELVPDIVEALVREREVDGALSILEEISATDSTGKLKSISIAYTRLLTALRETYDWDLALVERINRGIEQRNLPRQIPTTLLLAWAVSRKKYGSVLDLYNTIQKNLALDPYVFRALFEMHLAFHYNPKNTRYAPLAPRQLFHDMVQIARTREGDSPALVPDTALLTTALGAFMFQRDYAGALVVLESFSTFGVQLDNATFYAVVQPLVRRMWGDIAHKRRVRAGEVKWGDCFLGAAFDNVHLSEAMIARVLDAVSRERFFVTDPLYVPSASEVRKRKKAANTPEWAVSSREDLEAKRGAVKYHMPTMEMMETVHPNPPEQRVVYDPTPLRRLLHRAVVAEVLVGGGHDVDGAVSVSRDLVRSAVGAMTPLTEESESSLGQDDIGADLVVSIGQMADAIFSIHT